MDTSAVGSAGGAGSLTQAIAGNRQLGQQEFLKLLITQLTNQDPLSPTDDKEFLAQMAQFSTVEGVTQMSNSLGQIQGAALIGKTVDVRAVNDDGSGTMTGVVSGVTYQSDGVHLQVNGKDVTMNQITAVRNQ